MHIQIMAECKDVTSEGRGENDSEKREWGEGRGEENRLRGGKGGGKRERNKREK